VSKPMVLDHGNVKVIKQGVLMYTLRQNLVQNNWKSAKA